MLTLRGIDFGSVLNASGARGFAGEGYWHHRLLRPFGLDFAGATFVTKTATLLPRHGNMTLRGPSDPRPTSLWPDCIVVRPFDGVVLNAVGLSNPGIYHLAEMWRTKSSIWMRPGFHPPWMISIAAVGKNVRERQHEIRGIATALETTDLPRPYAIQLNLSCPNVKDGHIGLSDDEDDLVAEAASHVEALAVLDAPVLLKINALLDPAVAPRLPGDGLVVSNTIPFGAQVHWTNSLDLPWRELFGSDVASASPLARYGGGGLSGAPLLPIATEWVWRARSRGYDRPIVAGGGILEPRDAEHFMRYGADAVELGSISILRPWRVRATVRAATTFDDEKGRETR